MAHLTNFSFKFFYAPFTEDAPLLVLCHGAKKKVKNDHKLKSRGRGWSCLKFMITYQMSSQVVFWACIVRFRTAASMVAFLNSPKVIFCPISTNKISLERSWNYLNADSLCEKIWAKMNSWRSFEVGRQIVVGRRSGQSKIFRLTGCWRRGPYCHGNSLQLDCSGAEIEEEQSCRVVKERAS